MARAALASALALSAAAGLLIIVAAGQQQANHSRSQQQPFPGVSWQLSTFCAARPSLPVDLAAMVVHTKRNVSFNYKLYLFSADYVFQTGQVIPRDDFRVHAFPAKLKLLSEFWPATVSSDVGATPQKVASSSNLANVSAPPPNPSREPFDVKQFLAPVPTTIDLEYTYATTTSPSGEGPSPASHTASAPADALAEPLPGEPSRDDKAPGRRVPRARTLANYNKHVRFDDATGGAEDLKGAVSAAEDSEWLVPVGAFSSFHVNLTYLVRKDFGQTEPQLLRLLVDADSFSVTELTLLRLPPSAGSGASSRRRRRRKQARTGRQLPSSPLNATSVATPVAPPVPQSSSARPEDYGFLAHKLLRDPHTRITAINQIYEDWITKNHYTVVYIQRRLAGAGAGSLASEVSLESSEPNRLFDVDGTDPASRGDQAGPRPPSATIVTDRLVFRGSSSALLGADQLGYTVKAAAFITEKNGLHYFLEFLTNRKFQLAAIDWSKRPFRVLDAQRLPIKATLAQLDNEELLLCPPSVCFSQQPIDELVAYGRLALPDNLQRLAGARASSLQSNQDDPVAAERLESALNALGGRLQTRLHLRDWAWPLARMSPQTAPQHGNTQSHPHAMHRQEASAKEPKLQPHSSTNANISASSNHHRKNEEDATSKQQPHFEWHYEDAKRNEFKPKPDNYGYVVTGHEIDAAYRVFNELYLISSTQLITVNYTLDNETVISSQPLGEEFHGLQSTFLGPITGAFYDRFANQLFFFKGDRYIGFDYATKKPLDEFKPPTSRFGAPNDLTMSLAAAALAIGAELPILTSLPVSGILGRQHQVDAIYHDLATDLVYIFTGMKFYTLDAKEFKNGTFVEDIGDESASQEPAMLCINEHFISGCSFDEAYPNPCRDEAASSTSTPSSSHEPYESDPDAKSPHSWRPEDNQLGENRDLASPDELDGPLTTANNGNRLALLPAPGDLSSKYNFSDRQQMRLRNIATKTGFLGLLVKSNKLVAKEHLPETDSAYPMREAVAAQERIVVYMLMAMVAVTILLAIVMIGAVIFWTQRVKDIQAGNSDSPASLGYPSPPVGVATLPINGNNNHKPGHRLDDDGGFTTAL